MKQSTKELALCGVMTALSVVLLGGGGAFSAAAWAGQGGRCTVSVSGLLSAASAEA